MRWALSQALRKVPTGKSKDSQGNFAFHTTIAFRDIDTKFKQIWSYLKSTEEPNINQYLLRIIVLGARGRIVCEYDLVLKRLLSRKEALSKYWWRKTINRLGEDIKTIVIPADQGLDMVLPEIQPGATE